MRPATAPRSVAFGATRASKGVRMKLPSDLQTYLESCPPGLAWADPSQQWWQTTPSVGEVRERSIACPACPQEPLDPQQPRRGSSAIVALRAYPVARTDSPGNVTYWLGQCESCHTLYWSRGRGGAAT